MKLDCNSPLQELLGFGRKGKKKVKNEDNGECGNRIRDLSHAKRTLCQLS